MRFTIMIIVALLCGGCATSGITSEMQEGIPANATTVTLKSNLPPSEFYQEVYGTLRRKGCRFSEANQNMASLSTEPCTLGRSESILRIDVLIEPIEDGSILFATADYELMPGNWRPVAFRDSGTKYKVGFEELVLVMKDIEHEEMNYEIDEDRSRRAFSM